MLIGGLLFRVVCSLVCWLCSMVFSSVGLVGK